jgi:hypothetical protein
MLTKLTPFLIIFSFLIFSAQLEPVMARSPKLENGQSIIADAKQQDPRVKVLRDYLKGKNSPLSENAQDFVEAADKYNMDWRLVAAISGLESSFGRAYPEGTFNGWGWGYSKGGVKQFASWKEAIYEINKGLRKNYADKGLTNPYLMNKIYAASPTWGVRVSYFMEDIEKYGQKNNPGYRLAIANSVKFDDKDAGLSAVLASK